MPIVEFWIAFTSTVLLTVGFGLCLVLDKRRSLWVDRRYPGTGRTNLLYGDYRTAGRTEHRMYTTQRLYRTFKNRKWPVGGIVRYLTPAILLTNADVVRFVLSEEFIKARSRRDSSSEPIASRWNAFEDEHFSTLVKVATEESLKIATMLSCPEKLVDVKTITEQYVARVLTRCVFGKECVKKDHKFPITNALAEGSPGIVWDVVSTAFPDAWFTRALQKTLHHYQRYPSLLEELVSSMGNERTSNVSFLAHLKHTEHKVEKCDRLAFGHTKSLMVELVRNAFFIASSTMIACLYEMARNPTLQSRLNEVLLQRTGDSMVDYLDRVISETLRKYPPIDEISIVSGATNRTSSGDLVVAKNTLLIVPTYALQQDTELYPEPTRFDPNRAVFRSTSKSTNKCFYQPLGVEPQPIGSNFAMLMVRVGLESILRKCSVRLDASTPAVLEMSPHQTMPYPWGRVELLVGKAVTLPPPESEHSVEG